MAATRGKRNKAEAKRAKIRLQKIKKDIKNNVQGAPERLDKAKQKEASRKAEIDRMRRSKQIPVPAPHCFLGFESVTNCLPVRNVTKPTPPGKCSLCKHDFRRL